MSNTIAGRLPAIVRAYDKATRLCRVEIPGLTDGAEVLSEAEIEYPIGDKSRTGEHATEIEMLPGDTVWVCFMGGDPRWPIVTGYRNPQAGNAVDWRRWHQKNIGLHADEVLHLKAKHLIIDAETATINAATAVNGSALTHNDKNVGDDHAHGGVKAGGDTSGGPV